MSSLLLVLIFLEKKAKLLQRGEAEKEWMSYLGANDEGLKQVPEGKRRKISR